MALKVLRTTGNEDFIGPAVGWRGSCVDRGSGGAKGYQMPTEVLHMVLLVSLYCMFFMHLLRLNTSYG